MAIYLEPYSSNSPTFLHVFAFPPISRVVCSGDLWLPGEPKNLESISLIQKSFLRLNTATKQRMQAAQRFGCEEALPLTKASAGTKTLPCP